MGKLLIALGGLVVISGLLLWVAGRAGFRGLPGDIAWEGDGVRVYAPIASCLVLSVVLSLLLWLAQRLSR